MTPECKQRTGASRSSNAAPKQGKEGGIVTCSCCEQKLRLVHLSNGTHQVKHYSIHLADQQELPGFNT
jgi:transcription elongation factor Elf1